MRRTRDDADAIRARCQTFRGFFKEAWDTLEPSTALSWGWHMDAITEHLEAISLGTLSPRLIINVSPGCSKSLLTSVAWQAYEWGPLDLQGNKFLSTSFEMGNVTRDTRKTRDLILSDWYKELWNVQLKRFGETSFENQRTGTREGVPFGSLTAKRGDRLVIDDPHSLEGAESEVQREAAVRRFIEGGQNRLNDQTKSAIVIIMQRLHERDLTGEILARELGYEHLMIPMEFEPERLHMTQIGWKDPRSYDGELMDPVRFPPAAVALLKKDNDYMFAGQYQQRPAPREGGMFKIDKIEIVDSLPFGVPVRARVRGWDIAGSTKKRSPYTAGGRLALVGDVIYIEDMVRARAEIDAAERLIVDTCHDDGLAVKQSLPQDPGQAGKSQKLHLSGKLMGLDFLFSPETGTKEDRAIPLASMVNAGSVKMIRGPWNRPLIDELQNFPASAFKDQVDSLSRGFTEISKYLKRPVRGVGAPLVVGAND